MGDRSLHSSPADRTNIFFPDAVGDDSDDPRTHLAAEGLRQSRFSLAAALASDETVLGESHALSRSSDTGVVLSTAASNATPLGILRCNSGAEHSTDENGSRTPSAGSFATHCDRWGLVRPNVLKHLEEGPRELLSRKGQVSDRSC